VAGLTQEELGDRLRGWTSKPWGKAGVSAVERSWDGKRLRQFDADLLFGLAVALDVPVTAFFLPPDDDGVRERYLIHAHQPVGDLTDDRHFYWGTVCRSMSEYALYILWESPTDEDFPAQVAYRERLAAVSNLYFGVPLAPAEYFEELSSEEQLTDRISRLRGHYNGLREMLGDLEHTMEFLYDRLGEQRKQQAEANPDLTKHRVQERVNRMEAARMRHARQLLEEHRAGKSIEQLQEEHGSMPRNLVERYIEDAQAAEKDSDHEAT
jgi:transcriptional regulator with XRE-family HTH domain